MQFYDITELKRIMGIDPLDTTEDTNLGFYIRYATALISEALARPNLAVTSWTEIYRGTGTPKLVLRHRPVWPTPTPQVWVDEGAYYGAASGAFDPTTTALVYGTDFTVSWDQPNGTSKSAILIRINDVWPRPQARELGRLTPFVADDPGSIKVTYTAGHTVDTLPQVFRLATELVTLRLRHIMPTGMILTNESYIDRSVGYDTHNLLFNQVKGMLWNHRNWWF